MVETHLKNQEKVKVDGYIWIGNNRKRLHVNARCGSGGVGIKNDILKEFECETVENIYEGILWLTLNHKVDNFVWSYVYSGRLLFC